MNKIFFALAIAFITGSVATGCGDSGSSSGSPSVRTLSVNESLALNEGLADVSPAELVAVIPAVAPAEAEFPGLSEGPSWRRLLDPRPRLSFGRAVRQTRAPAALLSFYLEEGNSLPACATAMVDEGCIDGSTAAACNTSISFAAGCPIQFGNGGGKGKGQIKKPLMMEGRVLQSIVQSVPESAPGAGDGAWSRTISTGLTSTDSHTGRWLNFTGTVTQSFDGSSVAAPYTYSESWSVPAESPTALENDRGDKLAVFGSSQIQMLPGSSAESQVDIYQMLLLKGGNSRSIRRQVLTTMAALGENLMAVEIHSINTSLGSGEIWKRDGKFTVERLDDHSVMVSGSNVVVAPDGTTYDVRLTDVVFEDGLPAPVSGSATITVDGALVSTITFNGDCQAPSIAPDGTTSLVDVCSADRMREKKMVK